MERLKLAFGIHNHQPVGNFDWVFREGVETCYMPFMEMMAEHPSVRFSLHVSGPLIEWMDEGAPRFHELVARMVDDGQVEMIGGGFYEPILPVWPREHSVAQIRLMKNEIKRRYGFEAKGLWLAERVWDPSLPSVLQDAGVEYTVLDDSHFRYAGLTQKPMVGYYITERAGKHMAVLPISQELRYMIPFSEPKEIVDFLRSVAETNPGAVITYADDGEKFGIWPGTHDWVYKEKWLEKFLYAVEGARDWLDVVPLGEVVKYPPNGKIYLPNASYEEMMEWALPTDTILRYEKLLGKIGEKGLMEESRPFLRGGFWDNFFVKYPESNLMHKRVIEAASKVKSEIGPPDDPEDTHEAWRNIFRAQCNCAYWHGLFGGVYLNYLRHAIWKCLLSAERAVADDSRPELKVSEFDLDGSGNREIVVENGLGRWGFKKTGAMCFLIEDIENRYAFHNVVFRRSESYHFIKQKPGGVADHGEGDGPESIHNLTAGLQERPVYDRAPRASFIDHFFPEKNGPEDFSNSSWIELGDFWNSIWDADIEQNGDVATVKFARKGLVSNINVTAVKEFVFHKESGAVEVKARFDPKDQWPEGGRYGMAFNFTLLAPDAPDRYYLFNGEKPEDPRMESVGEVKDVANFEAVDEYEGVGLEWECEPAASVCRAPIQTLARSESGFEKTYQGSWVLINMPLPKGTEPLQLNVRWTIKLKG